MRKCTKSPGAIECEELDHDGVQLEACYCSSDLCNKDQACSCGLKCQTCLGQNGYCENPEDNGVASYCLKTESCAYVHLRKKAFLNSKLYFTFYCFQNPKVAGCQFQGDVRKYLLVAKLAYKYQNTKCVQFYFKW